MAAGFVLLAAYSLSMFVMGSVLIADLARVSRWSLEMLMIAFRISGVLGVSGPEERLAEVTEQLSEMDFRLPDIL